MTNDSKLSTLQAQVEATSFEEDTLIAKYEAIVKESEGVHTGHYEIRFWSKFSWVLVCCNN